MDEVDVDNVDLNELEARLYAQIHHEATETFSAPQTGHVEDSKDVSNTSGSAGGDTAAGTTSSTQSRRYWASGANYATITANQQQQQAQNTIYRIINQNKAFSSETATKSNKEFGNPQKTADICNDNAGVSFSGNKCTNVKNQQIGTALALSSNGNPKPPAKNNPKHVKNPFVRREEIMKELAKSSGNPKQGPFFKQQQKLEKAKRIEQKKQKSKKVFDKKQVVVDVVDLVSSDESDSSDVVVIPIPQPPTYSVEDSDDGENTKSLANDKKVLEHEDNALDSTDVQLLSNSSFVKPQCLATVAIGDDKRLENSSRCTSPCSIQSSDDFIGHSDCRRLLQSGSGMADDEDLLILTSDVNSLLEAPQSGQRDSGEHNKLLDTSKGSIEDCQNLFAPSSSDGRKSDYRVEGQFRAIDVYESESDIMDSVYSKGTSKTTVIRQIDTSSDEVEDISNSNQRTKRFRKRRSSSCNKNSDPNNEDNNSSSRMSGDDNDESRAERTGIPFISRGPAVERKIKKRSSLSVCSSNTTPAKYKSSDHMSDGDFIAKLNDLAQGQEGEDADDSDEMINTPSAREIAEKILGEAETTVPKELAVPKNLCAKLTDVFKVIDRMEDVKPEENLNILDPPTCSGQQKKIVYRSLPEEDNAQILTFVDDPTPSTSNGLCMKKQAANGSPIYNVIYGRGIQMTGGIGWNEEMRKFYEDSWNGERFLLSDIWKRMNPDRNLWKISNEDRYSKQIKRHNNLKCNNCYEFGHARFQCKRPIKPRICYMCGESGHQEPRCPNTMCLRCGNKTQVFVKGCNACSFQNRLVCPVCKIRGHSIDHCPDKWRRYHSTTEPNAFPNNTIVYNPRKYCSICGQRGHLADACRNAINFMEYPVIATAVKSHQKSYNDTAVKTPLSGIGFNLMYEPCIRYSFDMSQRTTSEKYYGRFLNAVGLNFLMTRKRSVSPQRCIDNSSAKKAKKSTQRTEPSLDDSNNAPNQVPEISESGNVEVENPKELDSSSVCAVESTVIDDDIQMNVVNIATSTRNRPNNIMPPVKVTSSNNTPHIMDSDSNYSFSEHFDDVGASTSNVTEISKESTNLSNVSRVLEISKAKSKSRAMEALPEFIPLVDSKDDCEASTHENFVSRGISRRFVAAESDDEKEESAKPPAIISAGLPCEAKIYLTHQHSKYLLSPDGCNFLANAAKKCSLKARLDFTTVGHVLVIFGVPDNQDKFQRELLMKYREISNHMQANQLQAIPNVPKRTDVLIRFLRDDIAQLLGNLGNVNNLYKRLQYVERQQSKSAFKSADKIRRSLNMILVGQAGLQDGNMHLDKLMNGLKTLLNDYRDEDVTPLSLRSEITSHWKVIFSSYRHNNYQNLIDNYNSLILKNRMPKLIIDPLLLGHKVLDTSLTIEQREKLEQPKQSVKTTSICEQFKPDVGTPKNVKQMKRKHNAGNTSNISSSSGPSGKDLMSPAKTTNEQIIRADKSNASTPIKSRSTANNLPVTPRNSSKQQHQKMMPPPAFVNPESGDTNSSQQSEISDQWRSTCETLLIEIAKSPQQKNNETVRDSKLPSSFWSRESMRYLDDCVAIVKTRLDLTEKIKRVQNKSKNGQLSYNDYLAVIKLHTALAGK